MSSVVDPAVEVEEKCIAQLPERRGVWRCRNAFEVTEGPACRWIAVLFLDVERKIVSKAGIARRGAHVVAYDVGSRSVRILHQENVTAIGEALIEEHVFAGRDAWVVYAVDDHANAFRGAHSREHVIEAARRGRRAGEIELEEAARGIPLHRAEHAAIALGVDDLFHRALHPGIDGAHPIAAPVPKRAAFELWLRRRRRRKGRQRERGRTHHDDSLPDIKTHRHSSSVAGRISRRRNRAIRGLRWGRAQHKPALGVTAGFLSSRLLGQTSPRLRPFFAGSRARSTREHQKSAFIISTSPVTIAFSAQPRFTRVVTIS